MLYKCFVFLFVVMPFFTMAQSSSSEWSLFLNATKLLSSSVDSVTSVQLSKQSKGNLQLVFTKRDAHFTRTVLLMDKNRNTFLQKKMNTRLTKAFFSVDDILAKSNRKPFIIYIVDAPADNSKLMGIRIAPVAICNVDWK